jgi:hypothetical protein
MTLNSMLKDLSNLARLGHGENPVRIYCAYCNKKDNYGVAYADAEGTLITINYYPNGPE